MRHQARLSARVAMLAVGASVGLVGLAAQSAPSRPATPVPTPAPAIGQTSAATPELLLDQGRRHFEAFEYDQALPVFDRLVGALTTGGQVQRQELLVQTYELRARARFSLGDAAGAEQDFSALLALSPSFKLGAGISPRIVAVLESVRALTIGQVQMSMTPAGEVQIDGRSVALRPEPQAFDLVAGDHVVTATRAGYRNLSQPFAVVAGQPSTLALTLERVSATLAIASIPAEVEVVLDGTSRGTTAPGTGEASTAFMINDLQPGSHRLVLRRPCHQDLERTITIERPEDVQTGPLRLTPSVATIRVESPEPTATVFVDGVRRGTGSMELANVCEGAHFIEVRGTKGRFVDRRDWKTGDAVTLTADLRTPFPVVATNGVPAAALERFRANLERALTPARLALVYFPSDRDLEAAIRGEEMPAGWLTPVTSGDAPAAPRVSREVRRDLGRRLATRLEVPGVASVAVAADPNVVQVALLAAGSGEPDVITINLADPTSRSRAAELLGAPLPPLTRASLDASVVDVVEVQGAVVVRTGPAGAKAGLVPGDVIVGAGGAAIATVADLRT